MILVGSINNQLSIVTEWGTMLGLVRFDLGQGLSGSGLIWVKFDLGQGLSGSSLIWVRAYLGQG